MTFDEAIKNEFPTGWEMVLLIITAGLTRWFNVYGIYD